MSTATNKIYTDKHTACYCIRIKVFRLGLFAGGEMPQAFLEISVFLLERRHSISAVEESHCSFSLSAVRIQERRRLGS